MQPVDKKYNFLRPIITQNLTRIGRDFDGGYIVDSNIIKKCKNLISLGLGDDWSFELNFLKINQNAKIHIYDHTVNVSPYLIKFIKIVKRFLTFRSNINELIVNFGLLKSYINLKFNKNISVFSKKVSHTKINSDDTTINEIFDKFDNQQKVILKVDIEESEYEIIDEVLNYSKNIEMMIFEFHFLKKNEEKFLRLTERINDKFFIVHLHGNNHGIKNSYEIPDILEITFVNKKYLPDSIKYRNNFPLEKLDFPNNPNKKDLYFHFTE